jgi:hypothetical protein
MVVDTADLITSPRLVETVEAEQVAGNQVISEYDYVLDDLDIVSVVRGLTADGTKALLRPAYQISSGVARKVHTPRWHRRTIQDPLVAFFDNCHLAPIETLRLICPWNRYPYPDNCSAMPPGMRRFVDTLTGHGGALYLYGSRALRWHAPNADWDVILEYSGDPRGLVDVVSAVTGLCVPLGRAALHARIAEYEHPPSGVPEADLMTIMRRSLTYVTIGRDQLDIIPRPRLPSEPVPDSFRSCPGLRITGELQPGLGESFAMPRVVRLRPDQGELVNIRHVSWLLLGVERLAGHRAVFSRLCRAPSGEFWFHAHSSEFRILE